MPLLGSKARIATLRVATAAGHKFVASHTRLVRRQHHACDRRVDRRQQFWPNSQPPFPPRILQSAWGLARSIATNPRTPNYSNCVSLIRGLRASAHYLRCNQYSGTASTGTPRLRPLFIVQTSPPARPPRGCHASTHYLQCQKSSGTAVRRNFRPTHVQF